MNQARQAGKILKQHGYRFDYVYTSLLKRAIWTWHTIADELDQHWIPHYKDWRINEKHYGALQGLDKEESKVVSQEKLDYWRSSFDARAPGIDIHDFRHPSHEAKYQFVPQKSLPGVESVKDTVDRVTPFWYNQICKKVMDNKKVVIVSHKNTLRAFFKHIQDISDEDIKKFKVPNALPIVYEFDANMNHVNNYCLMDKEAHKIKSDNPLLSYNDIDWAHIKGEEIEGGIEKQFATPVTKPLQRFNFEGNEI